MAYHLRPNPRHCTDEELLEDLRRIAKLLGKKTLGKRDYPKKGHFSETTYRTRFGSWNKALEKAGLQVGKMRLITNANLFQNLESIWLSLECAPP